MCPNVGKFAYYVFDLDNAIILRRLEIFPRLLDRANKIVLENRNTLKGELLQPIYQRRPDFFLENI